MHQDAFNRVKISQLVDPATATSTVTSTSIDLQNTEGVYLSVSFGESGDTLSGSVSWACKLQESDAAGSGFTDVAAADVIGATTNAFGLVDAAADDDAVYSLGYSGIKRYLRAVITATGTHTYGTPISCYAIQWYQQKATVGNVVTP